VSPPREVPPHIPLPPYAKSGKLPRLEMRPEVHDAAGIERMRASCKLAAQVLQRAGEMVAPGVTTDAIDAAVHEMIVSAGAYPSPLNYGKFPKSVCTSVNECLCHGIPDSRCGPAAGRRRRGVCAAGGCGGGCGGAWAPQCAMQCNPRPGTDKTPQQAAAGR
jgi:hypothetical protein